MRTTTALFLALSLLLAACHTSDTGRRVRTAAGEAPRSERNQAPAENPLSGAFYNDGGDGEVRGRTENSFASDDSKAGFAAQGEGFNRSDPTAAAAPKPPAERMLIQNGSVRVEVAHPDERIASFRRQVAAWGGHLQSQADTTLTVRVPVAHFEAAFDWVKQSGRVLSERRQADDVTEEFLDLGIRLENARRSRDRLLEVLQQADKVEDILKVEAELRRLTEEIERMEGRQKFLADQVALATLQATFQAVDEAPAARRRAQASRFDWINRIGAERVLEDF